VPACKKCRKELVWPQPYEKGKRPVEPDGKQSEHICGNIKQSCIFCPKGRVQGSHAAIVAHKSLYHKNNERIDLPNWEWRFLNRYTPYRMRHPNKKDDVQFDDDQVRLYNP